MRRRNFKGDGIREVVAKRYLPFGEGPRHCLGRTLAKLNMLATLASLLSNFSFRLAPEANDPSLFSRMPPL